MTLAEIARLAGVSRTTASYVVNGKSRQQRISAATVERVMAVIEAHGYQVDAQAAALRRGASRTLGFILPDLENASYARLAKLLEQGARAAGYQLLIVGSNDDPATERALAGALRARRCDGLIVASSLSPQERLYPRLMESGVPVVAVDRALDETRMACIISENRRTATELTASVITPRTREVVWLEALATLGNTVERRSGFAAASEAAGVTPRILAGARYDRESGQHLMREALARHGLPDALVSASWTLLAGALEILLSHYSIPALERHGLRLATFGSDRLLDFLPLGINAMIQDHERIAALALSHVLAAIGGASAPPGRIEVSRRFVRRDQREADSPARERSASACGDS